MTLTDRQMLALLDDLLDEAVGRGGDPEVDAWAMATLRPRILAEFIRLRAEGPKVVPADGAHFLAAHPEWSVDESPSQNAARIGSACQAYAVLGAMLLCDRGHTTIEDAEAWREEQSTITPWPVLCAGSDSEGRTLIEWLPGPEVRPFAGQRMLGREVPDLHTVVPATRAAVDHVRMILNRYWDGARAAFVLPPGQQSVAYMFDDFLRGRGSLRGEGDVDAALSPLLAEIAREDRSPKGDR